MNESDYDLIRSIRDTHKSLPGMVRAATFKAVANACVTNVERALSAPSLVMFCFSPEMEKRHDRVIVELGRSFSDAESPARTTRPLRRWPSFGVI